MTKNLILDTILARLAQTCAHNFFFRGFYFY